MNLEEELAKDLTYLRRESLDIYNRIHSIAEDVEFVNRTTAQYPDYPVIPNLRCGAWYVDPKLTVDHFAYFKSTDGHFNNWSFNLRRPNLHLLKVLTQSRGLILVDSTRAGKRMPDALSKTVPIWCAVINRALQLQYSCEPDWDTKLYTPPGGVSPQEHHQIKRSIDTWARSLDESSYILPHLALPLRPIWITPSTTSLPSISDEKCIPIICLSASKQVKEGLQRRAAGFTYIQGAGDDHELWGMGLTPEIFWANQETILGSDRTSFENLIRRLVSTSSAVISRDRKLPSPTPIIKVHGQISLTKVSDLPVSVSCLALKESENTDIAYVVIVPHSSMADDAEKSTTEEVVRKNVLRIQLPPQISATPHFLFYTILPKVTTFIELNLSQKRRICIVCPDGKDLGVAVAVVALQLFFDDLGELSLDKTPAKIDKTSIRTRLQWIITSRPEANPSRSTLKRVNEFLMSHKHNPLAHQPPPSSI